jgi:hypothetical protein
VVQSSDLGGFANEEEPAYLALQLIIAAADTVSLPLHPKVSVSLLLRLKVTMKSEPNVHLVIPGGYVTVSGRAEESQRRNW